MERIRKSQLEYMIKRVNELAGTPETAWVTLFLDAESGQWVEAKNLKSLASNKDESGNYASRNQKNVGQVGHIMLDRAYGGYQIVQLVNEGGGERHFGHGYRMSARETWMCLRSIEAALELNRS